MRLVVWVAYLLAFAPISVAEELRIEITQPKEGQALFDQVMLEAVVSGDEAIRRVEFWVNGSRVAALETPPYRVDVDVGEENKERTIWAIVHGVAGTRAISTLTVPPVQVDLAMELRLRQLYVTVTRGEEPVLSLERRDFRVFDNGLPQDIVTFEQGDVPMTIALLIDASSSMSGPSFSAALTAARGFLRRLGPLDEAMVMVFSDHLLQLTEFTPGSQTLPESFGQIRPSGGTAINDHLYAALRLLDARQGKPVVVLLSDGADTLSTLGMEEIRWKLRRSNALIYRLQVTRGPLHGAAFNSVWRTISGNLAESKSLREAIAATGGRVRAVAAIGELDGALDTVLQELRQQYVLGFYPSASREPGSWHPVRVQLTSPELLARTRDGYIER